MTVVVKNKGVYVRQIPILGRPQVDKLVDRAIYSIGCKFHYISAVTVSNNGKRNRRIEIQSIYKILKVAAPSKDIHIGKDDEGIWI